MKIGEEQSDDSLNRILRSIAINQCCTIVYTVRKINIFPTDFEKIPLLLLVWNRG